MSSYKSPYSAPLPSDGSTAASTAAAPPFPDPTASQSSLTALALLVEVPAPLGETALSAGGFLGPPQYAEGRVDVGEPFSQEDVRVKDAPEDAPLASGYPKPSQGGYNVPSVHGFKEPYVASPGPAFVPRPVPLLVANLQPSACLIEYPTGRKVYYILECLPCHKAFDSVAGAMVHLQEMPAHEDVRDIVGLHEAVEICGCRVVDATEVDFARIGRVAVGPPRHN